MEDILIWVDENDNETGSGPKLYTHEAGILHRAFSVFIFDNEKKHMLLQRRAFSKYHSGGKWSNACCSHPRAGESLFEAVRKRVTVELGIPVNEKMETQLIYCGSFTYRAELGALTEHELDHVFVWLTDMEAIDMIGFNPEEISELKWVKVSELDLWIKNRPEDFSAWFAPAYDIVKQKTYPGI